eukprot:403338785
MNPQSTIENEKQAEIIADKQEQITKSPYLGNLSKRFAKRNKLSQNILTGRSQTLKIAPSNEERVKQQASFIITEQSEVSQIVKDFEEEYIEFQNNTSFHDKRIIDNLQSTRNISQAETLCYNSDSSMNLKFNNTIKERIQNLRNLSSINTRDLQITRDNQEVSSALINADFSYRNHQFDNEEDDQWSDTQRKLQIRTNDKLISIQGPYENMTILDQKVAQLDFLKRSDQKCSNLQSEQSAQSTYQGIMRAKLEQHFAKRVVNISEFQVEFKLLNFIKFMIYHLLFFYIGPFASLIVLMVDSKYIMNNISFWVTTKNVPSFIVQLIQWISCMIVIGSWVQKEYKIIKNIEVNLEYIYVEQLYFFNILVLIRSFVIAVRYGYNSRFRLKALSSLNYNLKYIEQDLLIPNWINLNPEGLDLEIEAALWRNQVEQDTFKFTFIEELHKTIAQKLSDKNCYQKEESGFQMSAHRKLLLGFKNKIKTRRGTLEELDIINSGYDMFSLHSQNNISIKTLKDKKYRGDLVLREIALFAGAHQRSTKGFLIFAIFGKISLPFIARYFQHGTILLDWDSAVYTTFEVIGSSIFLLQNYFFVAAGHVDFQRRFLMIKSVGALLNPFKESYEVKYQIFPTINLASKESLHTWFQLRQCTMDFGRKYMMRIFFYSSVFLGAYLFYSATLLLSYLGFLNFQFSMVFNLLCLFDIILVLGVIFSMFYYGAEVNEEFIENKLQLIRIKQTLLYVKYNLHSLIDKNTKYTGAYLKIFQKIFQQIYIERNQQFQEKGNKYTEEDIIHSLKLQIDELVEQIESIVQRLENDYEHKPLKLLGLKATYSLMNQIYTTLFTVLLAVGQRFYTLQYGGDDSSSNGLI